MLYHRIRSSGIIFLFSLSFVHGQGIIIDHHAVQAFHDIPEDWLEKAKELTVHYGHTSHGSQIIAGLNYLEAYKDPAKYSFAITDRNADRSPELPAKQDVSALRMWEEGLWPYTADGKLGYWDGEEAQDGTRNVLKSGLFNVSGWAWCGQVGTEEWPYIQSYLEAMEQFEQEFPDITFFYMTGHCVAPGPPNHQQIQYDRLQSNNDGIREFCRENNKILFDFADIEAWDLDGVYHPEEDGTCVWGEEWIRENPDIYPDLPAFSNSGGGASCTTCAHAYGLTCVIKGQAFWYMMARIAGWDGTTTDIDHDLDAGNSVPGEIILEQNYPNPFNPSTRIQFTLPESEFTTLTIYNMLGKAVANLVSAKLRPGEHSYLFDGSNLASGVYYYSLKTDQGRIQTRKLILLR